MGREALAGKKEECPHGSFEKRDRKRNWRIWTELLSFSARQGRLCRDENVTPDQFSDWPQLLSLSAVGVWGTPKTIATLCRAATAQLDTEVSFPQAALGNVFPVFTPFFLRPYLRRPGPHPGMDLLLVTSARVWRLPGLLPPHWASSSPLHRNLGLHFNTHGDVAVCCKHLLD